MIRSSLAIVLAAIGCREPEPPRAAAPPVPAVPVAERDAARAIDDAQLAKLLGDADVRGAALVTDVATGAVVASAAVGREVAAPSRWRSSITRQIAASP